MFHLSRIIILGKFLLLQTPLFLCFISIKEETHFYISFRTKWILGIQNSTLNIFFRCLRCYIEQIYKSETCFSMNKYNFDRVVSQVSILQCKPCIHWSRLQIWWNTCYGVHLSHIFLCIWSMDTWCYATKTYVYFEHSCPLHMWIMDSSDW